MKPLRTLLVGTGVWGARIFDRCSDPEIGIHIVATYDERDLCGSLTGSTHLVDAAIVATPPSTHADVVLKLMQAGVRRIRVEKPLAHSVEEARCIRAAAREFDVYVQVGHTTVAAPEIDVLRGIVDVSHMHRWRSIRYSGNPPRHSIDAWWDLASHDVALQIALGYSEPGLGVTAGHGGVKCAQVAITHGGGGTVATFDQVARRIEWAGGVVDASNLPDPLGCDLRAFAAGVDNFEFGVEVVEALETFTPWVQV